MADWRTIIKNTLDNGYSQVFFSEPLSKHTTFRIGGNAECFIIASQVNDLIKTIEFSKNNNIPLFTIGNGSKLLVSSQGLSGITVKLGHKFNFISRNNNCLRVGAATSLHNLVQYACSESLSGVEFLCGIPATFGGAVVCNAGAFSNDISDCIDTVFGVDSNGQQISLLRNEIEYEYRQSKFPTAMVITEAIIELTPKDKHLIRNQQNKYQKHRKNAQPWGASVGSIFKNPISPSVGKIPAGRLIDEVGLKGLQCNDAYVSDKHANFIINKKNARTNDVYELIQIIKSKVELKFNIILQEEVQILPKYPEVKKWQSQKELLG
ncbi:MAG: UDP-N-acetylmuramate dehydrogenase [Candidatus Latescibacteria bacterium]|nr:UDP-N-acetylmuramate dehydrogenase [Candidatus Latescibacterota bacterium]